MQKEEKVEMKDSVWLVENSWNDAPHCDKVLLPDFGGNTHTHTNHLLQTNI